jgi:DNA-binding CsgD family transcriptional regulator
MRERLHTDYRWTPRQREVLDLIVRGRTNGEIATALGISVDGAKWHVSEIMSKLQTSSREEAAEYWRRYNGLPQRFERVFRGIVGGAALKVIAGAAAVGVIAVGVVTIALALNDDDKPTGELASSIETVTPPASRSATAAATPTAAPSPAASPVATACPLDAASCDLAERVLAAIRAGDVDALVAMGSPITATCPVPRPQGLGGPYPLCEDATVDGEIRQGYVWSSGSHGGLTDVAGFRRNLEQLMDADLSLRSIGCPVPSSGTDCEGDISLVFGPILYGGAVTGVYELPIRREDPSAPDGILGVLPAFLPECELEPTGSRCSLINGGEAPHTAYRHWGTGNEAGGDARPTATFFLWSPD